MDKQRKKQIKRYITWALIAVLVAVLAVLPLIASSTAAEDGPQASILSTQVQKRSIQTQLIGGGQLAGSSTEAITIPEEVKLTEYLVGNGDAVKEGDPIARVDKVSVMAALQEVQETLDYLAEEIADATKTSQTDTVNAHAGGLVKILYGKEGQDVREVMLEHGALAVLSLDSRMSVEIQRETELAVGDTVCVTLSDDTEAEGRVESTAGGVLTVSILDEGYAVGEKVTVTAEDGGRIGSGTLDIHSPWRATANQGTITKVNVKEGESLKAGKALFQLEVTGQSADVQLLHSQRQDYEELMHELFTMYSTGVLSAPCDGLVTGVDTNGAFLLAAAEETWQIQLLSNVVWHSGPNYELTLLSEQSGSWPSWGEWPDSGEQEEPENPEETTPTTTYTVRVGKVNTDGTVTICATYYGITSLASVPTSVGSGSGAESWPTTTLYDTSLNTYSGSVAAGDVLLEATDNTTGTIYYVYAGSGSESGDATQPDQEGEMGEMSGMPGGMGGGMGGMGGSVAAFEPYSLETITVANVTSQEEMTLEITVDEQDIARIARGQEATITVEALTGQQFPAVITAIGNTGTNEGGSSKFTAKLTLGKSGDMLPGMNASAYLTLNSTEDVLTIPVAALAEENGKTLVYTGYDEKNETLTGPVEVTTGVSDGEYVEILSGLSDSDTVWYAYYDTLERNQFPL